MHSLPAYYVRSGRYKIKLMAPNAFTAAIWAVQRYLTACRPAGELSAITGVSEQGFDTLMKLTYPTEDVAYMAGFPNVFNLRDEIHDECFDELDETGDLPW